MRILFIGFGAVARCVCTVWKLVLDIPIEKAVIIEPLKKEKGIDFPDWLNYVQLPIVLTKTNYNDILDEILRHFKHFDLVIDLSVYVDSLCMLDWCQKNRILYISTAIECWEEMELWNNTNENCKPLKECEGNIENLETLKPNTLQYRQKLALEKHAGSDVTALLDMGQNPGCVSIYVKCALDFLCDKYNISGKTYGEKAMKLGLETIHIAERDSQITDLVASEEVFYNTWSSIGFVEEAADPIQLGYGSHEDPVPTGVLYGNQILLPLRGMNVFVESYEPMGGKLIGRLISHSENNTITSCLKFGDYKPSTYYVYDSSKISRDSLEILKKRKYVVQPNFHVLTAGEIISGYDSVGVLFLFKDNLPSFWYGSIVMTDYAKAISPNINATTIQVAAGVLGGIDFMVKNPNKGVCFPESVSCHHQFLQKVQPLLQNIYCGFVDYKPKSNKIIDLIIKNDT